MERNQFTFYLSFAKAAEHIKKKTDRCAFYDVLKDYALYGITPDMEQLPDAVAVAFELVRPNLDSSKRKAEAGKVGGSRKKAEKKSEETESSEEANEKQIEADPKRGKPAREIEKEKEIENECLNILSSDDESTKVVSVVEASVIQDFKKRVGSSLSETAQEELRGFVKDLGADVCKRAIDVALDENKATWSYIRGILRNKREMGVRSLTDWDAAEARRAAGHRPTAEAAEDNGWMRAYIQQREQEAGA